MQYNTAVLIIRYLYSTERIWFVDNNLCVARDDSVDAGDIMKMLKAICKGKKISLKHINKQTVSASKHYFRLSDEMFIAMRSILEDTVIEEKKPIPTLLPSIFIGNERTQIRQVPLVSGPPYPFHFLLELGGMIILAPNQNPMVVIQDLAQYMNNFPQYEIRVLSRKRMDDTIAIVTYWFRELDDHEKLTNEPLEVRMLK